MSRLGLAVLSRTALDAIRAEAERRNIAICAAIVDAGAHLVAFERMDGAVIASAETSQVKTRTSALFGAPTRVFPHDKPVAPALLGGVGFPVGLFPGGIPVRQDGEILLAIGVGGSTGEHDDACATAGVCAVEAALAGVSAG